jgi:hypothetical protein
MSSTGKGGLPSQDSCMISKTQYSQKENQLRHRLYNISQKRAKETMKKEMEEDSKFQIDPNTFKSMKDTASIIEAAKKFQVDLSNQADTKMVEFIDEMRSQFSNNSNKNGIPQHILFQHTRILERQINLLEENQKTLTDMLNNSLNGGKRNSQYTMTQEIQNENRRILQDIIAPIKQR